MEVAASAKNVRYSITNTLGIKNITRGKGKPVASFTLGRRRAGAGFPRQKTNTVKRVVGEKDGSCARATGATVITNVATRATVTTNLATLATAAVATAVATSALTAAFTSTALTATFATAALTTNSLLTAAIPAAAVAAAVPYVRSACATV